MPAPDYGKELTPEIALSWGGPLNDQQGPGDLTQWMRSSLAGGYRLRHHPRLGPADGPPFQVKPMRFGNLEGLGRR